MARSAKSTSTPSQKRQSPNMAEGNQKRGASAKSSEGRAWPTMTKESGARKKASASRKTKKTTTRKARKSNGAKH